VDTWDPPTAETEFQEAYTAHPNINSAVIPNEQKSAAPIIRTCSPCTSPQDVPDTGQDATLTGLQNVLSGYQCGTVYKPIYLEAQAASATRPVPEGRQDASEELGERKDEDATTSVSVLRSRDARGGGSRRRT